MIGGGKKKYIGILAPGTYQSFSESIKGTTIKSNTLNGGDLELN